MTNSDFFSQAFRALTGHDRLRWQRRLYDRMLAGDLPVTCDLPTGLGKTSVIPIWLIAFGAQIEAEQAPRLPRRLIYIVNRRTVVDQATEVAERLRNRILGREASTPDAAQPLERLRRALERSRASSLGEPVAISTLRGEFADNEEWKVDPARPAIIIGTIDMVGSKLLFSGYGDGFRMRPHHAGLIGQDTLIVHDEAHLTPAFSALLRAIAEEQRKSKELRPVHVLELSATVSSTRNGPVLSLEHEDETDGVVRDRLDAQKSLRLHELATKVEPAAASVKSDNDATSAPASGLAGLAERIAKLALEYRNGEEKVLIYVHSPETAQQVVTKLKEDLGAPTQGRVALLTGTIRGRERDRLVEENPVYRALLRHDLRVERTVYLVSTSAGEVGIDLDADHMVCDLTTLDAMIQRLGRVNRGGGPGRTARVDLVIGTKKKGTERGQPKEKELTPLERAEANTKSALEQLPKCDDGHLDASPRALRELLTGMGDRKHEAFAPQPAIAPLTDIVLDAWALTSVREPLPGRPEVAPYLHGLTADPPDTFVAWRAEINLLAEAHAPRDVLRDWFLRCRVEARERVRDRTDRVLKELHKIARRAGDRVCVVVLSERGEAELLSFQDLLNRGQSALDFRTVVLPIEAGGLTSEGLLDGVVKEHANLDVAEVDGKRARYVIRRVGDTYWSAQIGAAPAREMEPETGQAHASIEQAAAEIAKGRGKFVSRLIPLMLPPDGQEDEAECRYLLLLVQPTQAAGDTPESAGYTQPPTLDTHCVEAARWADKIAIALGLEHLLGQALAAAARWHDRGKDRKLWQRAIFNETDKVLAKPGPSGMNWRVLHGYRHEFGSLLDAGADHEVGRHREAELILHLIAAHHGRARPHFEFDAWDTERHTTAQNAEAAQEVMRRFGRLQQRFGRWSLAWLESLVRCADVLASWQALDGNPAPPSRESEV